MNNLLIVGLGGFLGSILRYAVYVWFDKPLLAQFPWATFTVNVIGSFLLGIFYALAIKFDWFTEHWRLLLIIGFCGSFTTFSTFALEGVNFLKADQIFTTLIYITASVIASFFAVYVGYRLVGV